jgi:hypothetical protein
MFFQSDKRVLIPEATLTEKPESLIVAVAEYTAVQINTGSGTRRL